MTRIAAFIILFFLFQQCVLPEPGVPEVSVSDPPPAAMKRHNIMVSIDSKQQLYIGTQKIDTTLLDSLLPAEIKKFRALVDTPTVVINADTAAWYGTVFHIMKLSKMHGAKVVATIK